MITSPDFIILNVTNLTECHEIDIFERPNHIDIHWLLFNGYLIKLQLVFANEIECIWKRKNGYDKRTYEEPDVCEHFEHNRNQWCNLIEKF